MTDPQAAPVLEGKNLSKYFGRVVALDGVSIAVRPGQIVCLLGDNGAGKSTLIKMLSGVYRPDAGELCVDGKKVVIESPRQALRLGIATVYQDLALFPLMSITRNFIVGLEPAVGSGVFRRINWGRANDAAVQAMDDIGIDVRDPAQTVGTLSGGERQALAIARAEYRGARVLILDEPTSALGVKQAAVVLRHIVRTRARGIGVIFITHNPNHALPVGDEFIVLSHGREFGRFDRAHADELTLSRMMAGGEEFEHVRTELESLLAKGGVPAIAPIGATPPSEQV
jgi:simple sugar transport system ATP-binding protein